MEKIKIFIIILAVGLMSYHVFKSPKLQTNNFSINEQPTLVKNIRKPIINKVKKNMGTFQKLKNKIQNSKLKIEKKKIFSSTPFKENEIKVIGRALTLAKRYLDPGRGRESFQSSSYDNLENFKRATSQLKFKYPNSKKDLKPFIKQRVLSLHYIQNTKFLSLKACTEGLLDIVSQFNTELKKSLLINIEFDVAAISKACSRNFNDKFYEDIDLKNLPESLRAQVLTSIDYEGMEK